MRIPIQNIFYLLSYAWNRLDEAQLVEIDAASDTELLDMFARVLGSGVDHVIRRGLDRGYVLHEESIPGIKGKLLFGSTLAELPRRSGRSHCAFDDLSYDVLPNQILKATMRALLSARELNKDNRAMLADALRRFAWVGDVELSGNLFRRVQLHRNNAFYGFLLDVCALINENLLPGESPGDTKFRDFTRDESKMALLFQQFLRNFLDREQAVYKIQSPQLRWLASGSVADISMLPIMQTDIVATNSARKVVIDTKFYGEALQSSQYKVTVRSDHLYQMFAYLRHMRENTPTSASVEGVVVYPTVNRALDLQYFLDGHRFSIRTLNLDQDWHGIHSDALALLS